jgi:hypothetical protein
MKNKKILISSYPADFVKTATSHIAPSAKKCDAPAAFFKSMPFFFLSDIDGFKCTGCENLMADVVYKLDCYHFEQSFKSPPHCLSAYSWTSFLIMNSVAPIFAPSATSIILLVMIIIINVLDVGSIHAICECRQPIM